MKYIVLVFLLNCQIALALELNKSGLISPEELIACKTIFKECKSVGFENRNIWRVCIQNIKDGKKIPEVKTTPQQAMICLDARKGVIHKRHFFYNINFLN